MAASADYQDSASHEGQLDLLFLLNRGDEAASPWVAFDAAAVTAVSYGQRYLEPPAPGSPIQPGAFALEPTARSEASFTNAQARLASFQPVFELHVFTTGDSIPYEATAEGGSLHARHPVRMGAGGFDPVDTGDATVEDDGLDTSTFATLERAGPFVVHDADGEQASVTLHGDFVLELFGITLDVDSPAGSTKLASGTWHKPVEGAPEPTAAYAYEVHQKFVRLFLDDATLTLAADGAAAELAWAASAATMHAEGAVTFSRTTGRVHIGENEFAELKDDRFVLPAGSLLALAPRAEGLAVDISEPDVGQSGTIADVPAPASAALMGAGAVLALTLAIGVGVLRRYLRVPHLADVEAAIEQGEYRRAARLAGRILARRPGDESAVLARGIALAKAGDNEKAVRELAHHLSHSPASDGALHFVLGLAQLDLGRADEGRAALREAVRLTPALQAEVAPRLGKAFSAPASTTREASAYA